MAQVDVTIKIKIKQDQDQQRELSRVPAKDVTKTQQKRLESPKVILTLYASN